MVQSQKCIDSLVAWNAKQRYLKAQRLLNGKPKWKDEKYMNCSQIDVYLDKFLALEDDDDKPDLDQAKIALAIRGQNLKHTNTNANPLDAEE